MLPRVTVWLADVFLIVCRQLSKAQTKKRHQDLSTLTIRVSRFAGDKLNIRYHPS